MQILRIDGDAHDQEWRFAGSAEGGLRGRVDPMADLKNIRVAVNGYGVIGKRVAGAHGDWERFPIVRRHHGTRGRDARGRPERDRHAGRVARAGRRRRGLHAQTRRREEHRCLSPSRPEVHSAGGRETRGDGPLLRRRVELCQRARPLGEPRERDHEHAGAGARDSQPSGSRRPERGSGPRCRDDGCSTPSARHRASD